MSLHSIGFIKNLANHLGVEGEVPPDVQFVEGGYLFLASGEGEQTLRENFETQRFVVHGNMGEWGLGTRHGFRIDQREGWTTEGWLRFFLMRYKTFPEEFWSIIANMHALPWSLLMPVLP